jgi:hypothetical protein
MIFYYYNRLPLTTALGPAHSLESRGVVAAHTAITERILIDSHSTRMRSDTVHVP